MNNFPIAGKPSKGPLLGTIIIVLIIIIGGIYIISSRRGGETTPTAPPTDQPGTTATPPAPADQSGNPTDVAPVSSADTQADALTGFDAVQDDLTASEEDLKSLETEIK